MIEKKEKKTRKKTSNMITKILTISHHFHVLSVINFKIFITPFDILHKP